MVVVPDSRSDGRVHGVRVHMRMRARDGVPLAVECLGDPGSPAIVFAHGFGQMRQAWAATAAQLAQEDWYCLIADGRGHGDSGWREDGCYHIDQFVDDLTQLAQQSQAAPILVGASMGGLLGLLAQAERGAPFRALVLVDITPRWEAAGVERILAFMRAPPDGFETLDAAAAAIARYLPHRAGRTSPERLRKLLVARSDGRLRWHWDPRLLDRIATNGARYQTRLLKAAATLCVPTLLISGADSDVVSAATIHEFLALAPHARHIQVQRATHMVVGDRNDVFADAVRQFVEPLRPATPEAARSHK